MRNDQEQKAIGAMDVKNNNDGHNGVIFFRAFRRASWVEEVPSDGGLDMN